MFYERLRTARKACGYTQQQVSDYLGIQRSTYAYYESGRSEPPLDILRKLAVALGVTADQLIEETPYELCSPSYNANSGDYMRPGMGFLTDKERDLILLVRKNGSIDAVLAYAAKKTGGSTVEKW